MRDQFADTIEHIAELKAELERKEKLLHQMWDHIMDRDWPLVKLKERIAELEGELSDLRAERDRVASGNLACVECGSILARW